MTIRTLIPVLCGAAVLLMTAASCGKLPGSNDDAKRSPGPGAAGPMAPPAEGVTITESMLASIKTEAIREQKLPVTLVATGKVHFNEDRMARVVAPVSGQVQNLAVRVGDSIPKGQTLFHINSREVAVAITELLENQKDRDMAQKQYLMAKDLFEHEAGSRMAMQQAESDLAKSRARVARSEEALRILGVPMSGGERLDSRIAIPAPLSGTVIERKVTDGQFVQPDSAGALITLADMSTVWALADVFERDLRHVRLGQRAEVTTEAYPDRRFTARVAYIGDVVDPETRTVKLRFLVNNAESRLKPEMFASVRLFLSESETALCVPAKAVFMEGSRYFLFVKTGPATFVRREVGVASAPGDLQRITSGAKPGEQAVTTGALLLRQMEAKR